MHPPDSGSPRRPSHSVRRPAEAPEACGPDPAAGAGTGCCPHPRACRPAQEHPHRPARADAAASGWCGSRCSGWPGCTPQDSASRPASPAGHSWPERRARQLPVVPQSSHDAPPSRRTSAAAVCGYQLEMASRHSSGWTEFSYKNRSSRAHSSCGAGTHARAASAEPSLAIVRLTLSQQPDPVGSREQTRVYAS